MRILLAALRFNSACWLTFHAFVVVSRSADLAALSEFQTDWIQIRPNILPGLIQIVCKGYKKENLGPKIFLYIKYLSTAF